MGFSFQVGDLAMLISVALMGLGVRLVRIAWRGRSAPEALIAVYLLLAPPATSLLMRIPRFDPAYRDGLQTVAFFSMSLAALGLAAFAWRVFRPHQAWAKGLVALSGLYCLGMGVAVGGGSTTVDQETRSVAPRIVLLLTYIWLFVECVLQRRRIVRRLRLGLADPVVANRFLLFAIWSGVLAALPGATLVMARLVNPGLDDTGPFFAAVVRITGFAIYATIWLSFLPPRAYTRWIRRRHRERFPDPGAVAEA